MELQLHITKGKSWVTDARSRVNIVLGSMVNWFTRKIIPTWSDAFFQYRGSFRNDKIVKLFMMTDDDQQVIVLCVVIIKYR